MITQKEIKYLFSYDKESGILIWKNPPKYSPIKAGSIAGTPSDGYLAVKIHGKNYYVHILAWVYEHGYWPENDIDHIDRIKHHNWILNLRETSKQCGQRNRGIPKNNTTGVKGVRWNNTKWISQITISKKQYNEGFSDFDEAVCCRLAMEQCLNWEGCDSNSSAYRYVKENIQI